jgi:hypothetical protein
VNELVQKFVFMKQMMSSLGQNLGLMGKIPGLKQMAMARNMKKMMGRAGPGCPAWAASPAWAGGFPGMPGLGGFPACPAWAASPACPAWVLPRHGRLPRDDAGMGGDGGESLTKMKALSPKERTPRRRSASASATPARRAASELDEPAWEQAAKTGAFVGARSGRPQPGPLQGEARVFWDDAFLYVAIDIKDETVRGGFPADATDPHLWERDTAELMLDPDGADNRDYYELQINPQGLVFDSRFDDYNAPRGGPAGPFGHQTWSSQVERAVKVRGTLDDDSDRDAGYVVEARIPWASFDKATRAPPADGDGWKVNFYAMQDNAGVAWSPILGEGNFHRVRHFGEITFER